MMRRLVLGLIPGLLVPVAIVRAQTPRLPIPPIPPAPPAAPASAPAAAAAAPDTARGMREGQFVYETTLERDNSTTPLWHQETGEGSYGEVVKFQIRPNPLAG